METPKFYTVHAAGHDSLLFNTVRYFYRTSLEAARDAAEHLKEKSYTSIEIHYTDDAGKPVVEKVV